MKISRRKFILIGLTSFGVLIVSVAGLTSFEWIVRRMLHADLKKLNIDASVYDSFFKEAAKANMWDQFSMSKKALIRFHFWIENPFVRFPYYYKYLHYKNLIVEDFLMSTDFFVNKMDEKAKIEYTGLFDPYKRYCYNPFSSLFYNS